MTKKEQIIELVLKSGFFTLIREVKSSDAESCPGIIMGYLIESLKNKYVNDENATKLLELFRSVSWSMYGYLPKYPPYGDNLVKIFKSIPDDHERIVFYKSVSYPQFKSKLFEYMGEVMNKVNVIRMIVDLKPTGLIKINFYKPIVRSLCEFSIGPRIEIDKLIAYIGNQLKPGEFRTDEFNVFVIQTVSFSWVKHTDKAVLYEEAKARIEICEQ